jgi:hypothetical protein
MVGAQRLYQTENMKCCDSFIPMILRNMKSVALLDELIEGDVESERGGVAEARLLRRAVVLER